MGLLDELHGEGGTISMVTQDPRRVKHAARSVRLFDGSVEEEAAARAEEELRHRSLYG